MKPKADTSLYTAHKSQTLKVHKPHNRTSIGSMHSNISTLVIAQVKTYLHRPSNSLKQSLNKTYYVPTSLWFIRINQLISHKRIEFPLDLTLEGSDMCAFLPSFSTLLLYSRLLNTNHMHVFMASSD